MSWREKIGVGAQPIKRLHYFLITTLTFCFTFTLGFIFVLISENLFLISIIIGILGFLTYIEATGNRLRDAGIDSSYKWMNLIQPLGLFLFVLLLFKKTK